MAKKSASYYPSWAHDVCPIRIPRDLMTVRVLPFICTVGNIRSSQTSLCADRQWADHLTEAYAHRGSTNEDAPGRLLSARGRHRTVARTSTSTGGGRGHPPKAARWGSPKLVHLPPSDYIYKQSAGYFDHVFVWPWSR
jgi:hypothetical protein